MVLNVYDRNMIKQGVIDEITSLIWTRRYWAAGEFKLVVPLNADHVALLVKNNIVLKQGGTEAAEIRYLNIRKNKEGIEEIEVQGKFLAHWIGKRILEKQIITTDNTQNILYRIANECLISPAAARKAANIALDPTDTSTGSGRIAYTSEPYINGLLAAETAAKYAKIGFRMRTDARGKKHYFSVYAGRNLTSDQTDNPPCIFTQEFDNIIEQEYTNSVESLKTTAYVGGEESKEYTRIVVKVGDSATGLDRDEIFINATDITRVYTDDNDVEHTRTDAEIKAILTARGEEELEQYAETLNFSSKINTHANLKYKEDFDIGDRVTCINRNWLIKINVRITEIAETYEKNMPVEEIEITFGESLPALLTQIRQITK